MAVPEARVKGSSITEQHSAELYETDTNVITFWSDIGCPWATLALHTLHNAAARSGRRLLVDHRAFPLELFNRMPTPKFILDAEIVAISGLVPELGWRMWGGPEWTYPVTTLPALEAVQAAKDPAIGGLGGSDELDTALRRAFYTESKCISIPSVILEAADECPGVDTDALAAALSRGAGRAEVYRQWRVAEGPDVQGSPHLFTAGGYDAHNPGTAYRWTGDPLNGGFPRFDAYDPAWAAGLLDRLPR